MRDERDEPKVTWDVNGDKYYITQDGTKIPVDQDADCDAMKRLEDALIRKQSYGDGR